MSEKDWKAATQEIWGEKKPYETPRVSSSPITKAEIVEALEKTAWWSAFCAVPRVYTPGTDSQVMAVAAADFADAAIAEARKRGRL